MHSIPLSVLEGGRIRRPVGRSCPGGGFVLALIDLSLGFRGWVQGCGLLAEPFFWGWAFNVWRCSCDRELWSDDLLYLVSVGCAAKNVKVVTMSPSPFVLTLGVVPRFVIPVIARILGAFLAWFRRPPPYMRPSAEQAVPLWDQFCSGWQHLRALAFVVSQICLIPDLYFIGHRGPRSYLRRSGLFVVHLIVRG